MANKLSCTVLVVQDFELLFQAMCWVFRLGFDLLPLIGQPDAFEPWNLCLMQHNVLRGR